MCYVYRLCLTRIPDYSTRVGPARDSNLRSVDGCPALPAAVRWWLGP
jgi:hypothetical protein